MPVCVNIITTIFGEVGIAIVDLLWSYCRSLLIHYGEHLGLDSKKIPDKSSVSQFAEAMVKAWTEYNNSRLVSHKLLLHLHRSAKLLVTWNIFLGL